MSQLLAVYLGSLILRSIGIALIAGILTWKLRNVAMRHAVWVAVLGAMLLMPAIDYLLPTSWVPDRLQDSAVGQKIVVTVHAVKSSNVLSILPPTVQRAAPAAVHVRSVDWWRVSALLYGIVALTMFLRLGMGYWRIGRLKLRSKSITTVLWDEFTVLHPLRWRIPLLRESDMVRVPMTIGFLRPVVLLPAGWQSWDEWKLRAVLLHEFAHVRRGDWAIAAVAAAAKCAFWLNPLSWFLERKLSELAEQASDDASMTWSRNTTRYAEILLEFAAEAQNGSRYLKRGIAMAQHKMRARIERVLSNPDSGTGTLQLAGWMIVLLMATPVVYSAAALQVASERASVPMPKYTAAFAEPLLAEVPVVAGKPVPVVSSQTSTDSSNRQASPKNLLQTELLQKSLQQGNQTNSVTTATPIAATLVPGQENRSDTSSAGGYVIKPGDVLQVFVYKHPELGIEVVVQPDGRISVPLVQSIQAAGLSPEALKPAIEKRLLEVLDVAYVTVVVKSVQSSSVPAYRVFVVGKVQKPGVTASERPLTVLQALALSGGFQDYANKATITIIRTLPPQGANGQQEIRFNFNFDEAISGKNQLQNIYLENGDVVVVP